MAQNDPLESRPQTGAATWPVGGRARPGAIWPDFQFAIPARFREWATQEVAAGRLLPWLAVAYGFGVVLYFAAEREPAWPAAVALAIACASGAVWLRRHFVAFAIAMGVAAVAVGFAAATIKTALIDHPVLRFAGIMAQTPQAAGRSRLQV